MQSDYLEHMYILKRKGCRCHHVDARMMRWRNECMYMVERIGQWCQVGSVVVSTFFVDQVYVIVAGILCECDVCGIGEVA